MNALPISTDEQMDISHKSFFQTITSSQYFIIVPFALKRNQNKFQLTFKEKEEKMKTIIYKSSDVMVLTSFIILAFSFTSCKKEQRANTTTDVQLHRNLSLDFFRF